MIFIISVAELLLEARPVMTTLWTGIFLSFGFGPRNIFFSGNNFFHCFRWGSFSTSSSERVISCMGRMPNSLLTLPLSEAPMRTIAPSTTMPSLVVVTASISNILIAAGPSIVEATLRIASSWERPLFSISLTSRNTTDTGIILLSISPPGRTLYFMMYAPP